METLLSVLGGFQVIYHGVSAYKTKSLERRMSHRAEAQEVVRARAFAPGHVTGLFAPAQIGRDPRGRGSVGAGLVLPLGVWAEATFIPGEPQRPQMAADIHRALPISRDVLERVGAGAPGALRVRLRHELPIGQGFGMSAAGALATALSTASVLDRSPPRAIEVAHLAELFHRGGLGGVAAILGGGLEIRTRPGLPPIGRIERRAFPYPIFLSVVGPPIPTPARLSEAAFLGRAGDAGLSRLRTLGRSGSARRFLSLAQSFGDDVGLATPRLAQLLARIRSPTVFACQTMLGQSLFAVPTTSAARRSLIRRLRESGMPAVEVRSPDRGAWVTPEPAEAASTVAASRPGPRAIARRRATSLGKRFNRRPARPRPR